MVALALVVEARHGQLCTAAADAHCGGRLPLAPRPAGSLTKAAAANIISLDAGQRADELVARLGAVLAGAAADPERVGTLGALTEITMRLRARPEVDRTLALEARAEDAWGWLRAAPFSPLTMDSQIARFPGSGGGPEWGGGAFDPKLGYFIVNTQELGSIEQLEKKKDGYWGSTTGPDSFLEQEIAGHGYYPCQNPPWGDLWAVNVNTGKVAWRVNLGVSDIMPEGKRNTGRPNLGAPLTTASGLIFIGATDDSRFRAFETKTGKELWTQKLEASAHLFHRAQEAHARWIHADPFQLQFAAREQQSGSEEERGRREVARNLP